MKTRSIILKKSMKHGCGLLFLLILITSKNAIAQFTNAVGIPIYHWSFEDNATHSVFTTGTSQQINAGGAATMVGATSAAGNGNGVFYGGAAGVGWMGTGWTANSNPGVAATQYYQFSFNTTGFNGIAILVDRKSGSSVATAPQNMEVLYSSDGVSFADLGSVLLTNGTYATLAVTFGATFNNNPNCVIRLVPWGITTPSGASTQVTIDNFTVYATSTAVNAGTKNSLDEVTLASAYLSTNIVGAFSRYGVFSVNSGSELVVTNLNPGFVIGLNFATTYGLIVNSGGTLSVGDGFVYGAGGFILNSGGTLKNSYVGGITAGVTASGVIRTTGVRTFNAGANYIYNGTSAQITGTGLPTAFVSPGSVTIDNASGVSLTSATTFGANDTVNLKNGQFTITPGLTFNTASAYIQRDNGTFSTAPTFSVANAVNVIYKNLGINTLTQTTGNELPAAATTLRNLTVNKADANITLGASATVNGTLTLNGGLLTLGAQNLNLGSASPAVAGTLNNTSMIVTNSTGAVQKVFSSATSYLFPVGDLTSGPTYAPITLSPTGFTAGASLSARTTNAKHPNNANTTDYLNRYWTVGKTGFTDYSVTSAKYNPSAYTGAPGGGDVTGTEANIYSGQWTGATPWVRYAAVNTGANTLSSTAVTAASAQFSGINQPVPTFTASPSATTCVGTDVTYTTQPGQNNYTWNVPGTGGGSDYSITSGGIGTGSNTVTIHWITQGNQTVTVNYTDDNGLTGVSAASASTTVIDVPATSGMGGNNQMCEGGASINLTNTAINGTWSSATSSVATVVSGTGVASPGVQGITVITYQNVCGSASITATVNATPAGITGNTQMCAGSSTITVANTSTNGTWSSTVPTVASVNASSGLVTSGVQGTTVISYSNGCGSAASVTASVNATPAGITNNSMMCAGGATITLGNTSTNGTWSSTAPTVASINATSGLVTSGVQGTAIISYDNGCGSAASITATVNATPANITNNSMMCAGGANITLGNTSTNGTWSSATPAVASVNTTSGLVTSGIQGTTVISYDNGCGSAASITATVNATPAAITNNSMMCAGGTTITLGNTSTNGTWSSAAPTVASVNATSGLVTSGVQGTTVISYSNGCGSAASITATVNAMPAGIAGNSQMCEGGAGITLSNSSTNGTWTSDNTPVADVDMMTGVVTSGVQGTAVITYNNGCGTAVTTATVNAAPAPIGNNGQLCTGGNALVLTNTSTNGTWSGGTAGVATIDQASGQVVSGNTQGTTTFSYSNGCGVATSVTTTVNAIPSAIGGSAPICAGGLTVTLTNTATNGTWSSNDMSVATIGLHTGVLTTGAGGLALITYDNGCAPAATVTFTVTPTPTVYTFTGGGGFCTGDPGVSIGLTMTETGVNYQLFAGATAQSSIIAGTGGAITFGTAYNVPGYYYAVATDAMAGCTVTLPGVTVHENPLPDVFNVTGGGSYCSSGGSGVAVGLDNSTIGVDYQLYEGATLITTLPGTGAPISFGLQPAGTYTVMAMNATTGCMNAMSGSALVDFYPLPPLHTVTGGGTYCLGGAGVQIGLDGSDEGIDYQLIYLGVIPIGGAVDGTNAALDMGLHFLPGDYTIVARDTTTGCTDTMTDAAQINFALPPTFYFVGGGGSYCAGDTGVHITLSGSSLGVSYQIYRADTAIGTPIDGTGSGLDFGAFTTVGIYTVLATDITTGCTSNMFFSATVSVNPVVAPSVSLNTGVGADNRVCYGNAITFTAQTMNGGTAPTYEWKINNITVTPPDSTYTYVPTNGDIVWVRMTSSSFCAVPTQAMDTMHVDVDTMAAPSVFITVDPLTSITPGTMVTMTATVINGGPAPLFQWYKNGIAIAGATSAVYSSNTFANRDSITVRVITSGGCGGAVTFNGVRLIVYAVGVPNVPVAFSDIRLVPNPNKGMFSVTGTLSTSDDAVVNLEVVNMLGQVVYKGKATAKSGVINEQIQLTSNLANGMYMLNLQSGEDRKVFHFVLEQ